MKSSSGSILRQTSKTIKTVAKLNLINVFNESVAKPIRKFIKDEICDSYREKLKTEFHKPCDTMEFDSYTNLDNTFVRSKNVSLAFRGITDISADMQDFVKKHNPPKEMLSDIYDMLRRNGIHIVEDRQVCFPSPKKYERVEFIEMSSGRYVHLGMERFLKRVLEMNGVKAQDEYNKILFVDIAFFVVKSSSKTNSAIELPQHLVILARPAGGYYNHHCKEPFVIGVYEGLFSSPTIANEILRPFVDEMLSLRDNKVVHNDMVFTVQVRAIICDPIANSLVTCTSLPDSQYGCSKCNVTGTLQFNHGITSFPKFSQTTSLRCDDDFLNPNQIDHHTGVPILRELDLGLITQVYIDYKAVVCMGVMKRLLELWITKGKLDYRLNKKMVTIISNELEMISKGIPKEFTAKPKSLNDIKNWDAYDFRQFLLYYGPVVLHKRLPQKYYVNFLHLNLAMRIMINPDGLIQCSANICSGLLRTFVSEFAELYGPDLIDHNFHNLLHLEDVSFKSFSLDSVGGFTYGKQMDVISEHIQQNTSLEDLKLKIEQNTTEILEKSHKLSSHGYPYLDADMNLICRYALIGKDEPNNYVITTKGELVVIDEITKTDSGEILIYGCRATNVIMYQAPSTNQKMMLVMAKLSRELFKLNQIKAKGVKIATSAGDFILPLLTP